jgi:MFS family permease
MSANAAFRKQNIYIPAIFSFILFDEICSSYIFQVFNSQDNRQELFLFVGYLLIEMIASPIQAGFSDFYCRKKSLVVSLSFSLLSMILIFMYSSTSGHSAWILLLVILAKAGLGNNLPLSWAAIADTHTTKNNFRFSLAFSTTAIAIAFLVLAGLNRLFSQPGSNIVLICAFFFLTLFCMKNFSDIRDRSKDPAHWNPGSEKRHLSHAFRLIWGEIGMIVKELRHRHLSGALLAFLLWQISFYSVNALDVDLKVKQFSNLTTTMMFGYLIGVGILRFFPTVQDIKMVRFGYYICVGSVIPFLILYYFIESTRTLLLICYFFYNLGTAFMPASLFSILSKKKSFHEQGKIYGLIDSANTLAFLLSSIVAIVYNSFKINQIVIVSFSLIVFLISWIPYRRFEQIVK